MEATTCKCNTGWPRLPGSLPRGSPARVKHLAIH